LEGSPDFLFSTELDDPACKLPQQLSRIISIVQGPSQHSCSRFDRTIAKP
jgi:hypothetical protein